MPTPKTQLEMGLILFSTSELTALRTLNTIQKNLNFAPVNFHLETLHFEG